MSQVVDFSAFDRASEPLLSLLTSEQLMRLAELGPDSRLATRVAELANRANEGELSDGERAEYEAYVRVNNLMAILQGLARRRLAHN